MAEHNICITVYIIYIYYIILYYRKKTKTVQKYHCVKKLITVNCNSRIFQVSTTNIILIKSKYIKNRFEE